MSLVQPFQSGIKRICLLSSQVTFIPENQFPREIMLELLDAAVLCTGLSKDVVMHQLCHQQDSVPHEAL